MGCVNEVCKLSTFGSRSTRTERRADSAVVLRIDEEEMLSEGPAPVGANPVMVS